MKRRSVAGYALVALLLIAIVGTALVYVGPSLLCVGCNPGVSNTGSKYTGHIVTLSSSITAFTVNNPQGSAWPIGNAAASFSVSQSWPYGQIGSWIITAPATDPASCYNSGSAAPSCQTSSYVFQPSVSSAALLSSGNNAALWGYESSTLNGQNPYTFNSTYTSNVNAPAGCTGSNVVLSSQQTCVVQYAIYRYYLAVNLQTGGATIQIFCSSTCASSCSIFNCGFASNTNYVQAFQQGISGALNTINAASTLSAPTLVNVQLNVPPSIGGQSNLDRYGVIAAWTANPCAGQSGNPVGSLCETNCGGSSGGYGVCSVVESQVHTPFNLFADAGETQPYTPSVGPFLNTQSYTASQLASLAPSSWLPTVYAELDVTNFGAQYQMNTANCTPNALGQCFNVSTPQAVVTVMFDVITTSHSYKSYPSPAPQTGTNAGGVDGQIVDGSLFWHPGVAGASICFTDISGCAAVNGNGVFNFTNVAAGTHNVQILAPNFYPQTVTVNVGTGIVSHLGQVSLAELNPWYLAQLCVPSPLQNPLNPSSNLFCIPYVIIFLTAGIITVVAVVYVKARAKVKL